MNATGETKEVSMTNTTKTTPNLFPRLVNLKITKTKRTVQGGVKQVIVSVHPFENPLCLYCISVDLQYGLVGCLTLIFKADLPSLLIDG